MCRRACASRRVWRRCWPPTPAPAGDKGASASFARRGRGPARQALPAAYAAYASVAPSSPPRICTLLAARARPAGITAHQRLGSSALPAASGGAAVAGLQPVEDLADARHGGGDVLRQAPRGAMLHPALERDVAVLHAHVDLARIQPRVVRHPLADVLADQLVRALAVVRPALGLRPRRQRRVAVAADAGADLPAGLGFAAPASAPLGRTVVPPEIAPLERLHGQ